VAALTVRKIRIILKVPERTEHVVTDLGTYSVRPLCSSASLLPMLGASTIHPPCQSAIAHGHDAVVLGAFGCGAFRNPAAHMAQLFREVSEPSLLAHDVWEGEGGAGL
jgi:hypothetical protein